MKLGKRLAKEEGNALIEGIGFAVVAFGLLLGSSLYLFDEQVKSLEMASIARNAMREYLMDSSRSMDQLVLLQQVGTSLTEETLNIVAKCGKDCSAGDQITLELSLAGIRARAFGVIDD